MNKNMNKKIIIGFATIIAILGFAKMAFAGTPILSVSPNPTVTTSTANFSVFYDMNGDVLTSVAVRYGTNTLMQSNTTSQSPSASSGTLSFSTNGLSAGTTYYFQAIGVSSNGTVVSSRYTFTTKSVSAPSVQTYPNPTNISENSANLSGFFQDNGTSLSNLVFEYGTSTSLGSTKNISFSGSSGTVYATISNLSANTKYYYRISGTNSASTVNGSVYSFTTLNSTNNNNNNTNNCVITDFSASSYQVNRGDKVTIYYNTRNCTSKNISNYGSVYGDSNSFSVSVYEDTRYVLSASNSQNSTSQSFRIYVNSNSNNNNNNNNNKDCNYYGNCQNTNTGNKNNTTNNTSVRSSTGVVNEASPTSAVFTGSVYSNQGQSFASFEYGTTPNLGRTTARLSSNGSYNTNFIYTVYDLKPNTTYYFRIVGESNGMVSVGDILYFKTPSQGSTSTVITNTTNKSSTSNKNTDIGIGKTKNSSSTNTDDENSDTVVGGVDNNRDGNFLSAGAGFSGTFFPGTIFGWLIIILIILIVVMIARRVFSGYKVTKVKTS